jgi:hypothetical protein
MTVALWRINKAGLSYIEQYFIVENCMQQENKLFDVSRNTWQSFSSKELVRVDCEIESIQALTLQWFYCHLSNHQVFMIGVDSIVGYQLAADMLDEPIDTISAEDEQDAVVELVNCICGQLDRDHPASECFGVPKPLMPEDINRVLSGLNKLSDAMAKVSGAFLYIALFKAKNIKAQDVKAKNVEDHGGVE